MPELSVNRAQANLLKALQNQYNLRARKEIADAAGFNFVNYNKLKNQANQRIRNAINALERATRNARL